MKTNRLSLIALIGALLVASACDDQLELRDPNNIGPEIALANDKNVKSTLVGAYNALSAGAFFGGNSLRNGEIMAANGEIVFSGTFNDVADIYRKEIVTANSDVTNLWIAAYGTINICNNVLSALPVVDEEDQAQVEGEARFLRAVSYFELILYYAQPYSAGNTTSNPGVPIMDVEDRNSLEPKPRNSVEEVYNFIVTDLTTAETLLAEGPSSGKATKEAAAAILSRVYLQMANYAGARDAANRAIATGNYGLEGNVFDAFNGGSSSEDLFDIPVSSVDGVNNMNTFYASSTNGGRGDIEVMPAHLALYTATDDRLGLFYIDASTGDTRVGKWINRYGSVKIVRLAEMYLTRAEANFRLGTTTGDTPLNDLNAVHTRAGLTPLASVTLNQILDERRLELAHEGQRLHDIKRLQLNIVEGATTYTYDNDFIVFPIPQRERDVNENLSQNEGYGAQ
jgi:starch-binding outer membrane protein, SusD/RagB family